METQRKLHTAPPGTELFTDFHVAKSCHKATGTTEEEIIGLIRKNDVPGTVKVIIF
jgi:hypothetical protein